MCILSYLPPHIPVDQDGLLTGGINNPDGHGWAVTAGDKILIGKSMSLIEALDGFLEAREAHPGSHALFHSRWATHGSLSVDNVHPFVSGHSPQTVVAHNGILPSAAWPSKGDSRSDTRIFADELLSGRYRRLNRPRVREALTNWIGTGNKLVILTVDQRYQQNAYLINEKRGIWSKSGIWHSNYDYIASRWSYSSATKGTGKSAQQSANAMLALAESTAEQCYICEYGRVDDRTNYCSECGTCQDCLEGKFDCFCFNKPIVDTRGDDQVWGRVTWSDDDYPTFADDRDPTETEVM